jgi:hypothetical protein
VVAMNVVDDDRSTPQRQELPLRRPAVGSRQTTRTAERAAAARRRLRHAGRNRLGRASGR